MFALLMCALHTPSNVLLVLAIPAYFSSVLCTLLSTPRYIPFAYRRIILMLAFVDYFWYLTESSWGSKCMVE